MILSYKLLYTLLSVMVFVIFTNPYMYKMLDKMLGSYMRMSTFDGCPTMNGMLVSAIMFGVVIYIMMISNEMIDKVRYKLYGEKMKEEEVIISETKIPVVKVEEDEKESENRRETFTQLVR